MIQIDLIITSELNRYLEDLIDDVMEDIRSYNIELFKNFNKKDMKKNIRKIAIKYARGGKISSLYPSIKAYQIIANQYRKWFCKKKARPLKYGELHWGCHNFTGPGTRIDIKNVRNYKPYNDIDKCSKEHDINYEKANKLGWKENLKAIREADKKVVKCYDRYPEEDGYRVSKLGINSKVKFEKALPILSKGLLGKYAGGKYREYSLAFGAEAEGTEIGILNISRSNGVSYHASGMGQRPTAAKPHMARHKIAHKIIKYKKVTEGLFCDEYNAPEDETISQIPSSNRECLYVFGVSGCGKTTYIKNYAQWYLKLKRGKDIFLFSKLEEDPSIDNLKGMRRIKIDNKIVENPIKPEELKNSLVIFDDINTIRDKKIRKEILKLSNDLLEVGRHSNIYVINSNHEASKGDETRIMISESTSITLFPYCGNIGSTRNVLRFYIGLSKEEIDRIFKLSSRWVTLFKNYPRIIMYEKGVYIL